MHESLSLRLLQLSQSSLQGHLLGIHDLEDLLRIKTPPLGGYLLYIVCVVISVVEKNLEK